ncbi:unnamed protein product, partial [Anisakis simplex]|uniref:HIT-type domain-containing protein n=1 Tax=Anisakis simplex TaxID=6269 RepID=A0A0M3JHE6_ANISI
MVDESAVGENESEASPKSVVRLCDQCRKEPFKYKCPRCLFRSCSLQCSKHHKEQHN